MADTARKRARWKIGATAREMDGAHYVNGAKGARPNKKDGAAVRPNTVALEMVTALDRLAFFAASVALQKTDKVTTKTSPDKHVCGGIYDTIGGLLVSDADAILRKYLGEQNPKSPADCWTKGGLTPRRLAGSRDTKNTGRVVWGESCDGWRHFDCIGLVEFAVQQVVKRTIGGEIYQFASPKNVLGATRVSDDKDVRDGDLVSQVDQDGKYHHIGVIYLEGGTPLVAQAAQTSVGVTTGTAYDKVKWSGGRWRLPDGLLMADGEVSDDIPDNRYRPTVPLPAWD
jgi:hypothetical protein